VLLGAGWTCFRSCTEWERNGRVMLYLDIGLLGHSQFAGIYLCGRNLDSEVEIEDFSNQFRGIRLSELDHGLHLSLHVIRSRVGMGIEDW
jgi:hypothetical protein